MALKESDYEEIRKELDSSENPLIFFDDDPDGVVSYLQLYKYMKKGNAIMVTGYVTDKFAEYVVKYNPDKIFIVDKPVITQEFVDKAKKPIIWIDHHQPLNLENVKYFNPMSTEPRINPPASHLTYQATKSSLWLSTIGTLADTQITEVVEEFSKKYPDILSKEELNEKAFVNPKIIKMINSIIFGLLENDIYPFLENLNKIETPYELLNSETEPAKKINKIYQKYNDVYEELLEDAKKTIKPDSKFIFFTYESDNGYTALISNQLSYANPDKIIIIGRKKENFVRMSLRGSGENKILPAVKEATKGLDAEGGGHLYACGVGVSPDHLELFVENFKKQFD